jgi:hypothetical protein
MNWNRIRHIEFILFLIGWPLVILTTGSFSVRSTVLIIIMTVIIDVIQDFWLRYLSGHMVRERTFLKTVILYAIVGFACAMGMVMTDSMASATSLGTAFLVMVLAVFILYSIVFWLINRQIKHFEIMHPKKK